MAAVFNVHARVVQPLCMGGGCPCKNPPNCRTAAAAVPPPRKHADGNTRDSYLTVEILVTNTSDNNNSIRDCEWFMILCREVSVILVIVDLKLIKSIEIIRWTLSLPYDSVGVYLMSYSIGTPPFKVYAFLDTGSNLIWHECKPCNICYNQTSPIFNPSKSSSYQNIPCSSRTCKSMANASCSYDRDACEYTLDYGHGTKTQGDLSVETLTLDSISGSVISFSKIVIGCAHTNTQGFEYNGKSSGIVGLGKGPMSIIKQLGSLTDYYRTSNLSSKLNFGDAAIVSGDKVVSTPMVKMIGNQQKDYYYLTLKAFSVGNKRIKYKGFKREGTNASTNNIIIDSGTPVSLLPRHVFHKLESAVKKVIKLERFQDPTDSFSLCYNTTSKKLNFPVITAHFSGADVKLDPKGVFSTIFKGIECFAFRPHNNGLGLFGSMAQMNHLIGHDLKRNIFSFKPTDCSKY
ncbi:aspartic proteinase CDR1-like [Vicia villosa]|uniref:aspartic proteinase CDR1-like n=1 Tax=Vicia villosa TaxID=3911 RepID=UPI00273AFA08|nr:aspartic proteinase CDR1-like [Vicia villosa]